MHDYLFLSEEKTLSQDKVIFLGKKFVVLISIIRVFFLGLIVFHSLKKIVFIINNNYKDYKAK